jgi:hypothetical protein
MTRAEVLDVLASRNFEPLVGLAETIDVEFKGQPYQIADHDSQKFELAKDVSALANASGGVIVIGVQTERDNEASVDVAAELRPLALGLVDEQQYEGILSDMIYPRLREVQVRFHSSTADPDRGLVSIDVPPQDEVDKYFLIQRPIEEGVDRTPGWLVGLAVRNIGRVEGRRIGEVHTLINRGLVVGRQLDDVVEGLAELRDLAVRDVAEPQETPANRLPELLRQRLDEYEADA